jgi:hypothetical protein|eukprot:COSAG06_NODE_394_length_16313_cov_11.756568_17_plen_75_part_00
MAKGERVALTVVDPRCQQQQTPSPSGSSSGDGRAAGGAAAADDATQQRQEHDVLAPPRATIRAVITRLDAQGAA